LDLRYDTIKFDGDQGVKFNQADLDRLTQALFLFARKPVSDTLVLSGGVRIEQAETSGKNNTYNTADDEPFLPNPWGAPIPNPNYPAQPIPNESFDKTVTKQGWAADFSLSWQATDSFALWAGYDRIYHYPALDEVASYQGFALPDPFNENLDPETGHNFEIGAKYRDETWTASATLFYMILCGEIAYDSVINQNVNIGDTSRLGADLDLEWKKENYGASAHCALVRAQFDGGPNDGKTVPLVPSMYTTTSFWIKPVDSLHLRATHHWTASQFGGGDKNNVEQKMDPYHLVNLSAELTINPKLKLFFKIDNLFDQQYASTAYSQGYYPGSGRGFYGGLNLEL